jgi:hypothetical protein
MGSTDKEGWMASLEQYCQLANRPLGTGNRLVHPQSMALNAKKVSEGRHSCYPLVNEAEFDEEELLE